MRHAKMLIVLLMVSALAIFGGAAQNTRVQAAQADISFSLPGMLKPAEIPSDADDMGVCYLAQNEDESLRFAMLVRPVRRSSDKDAAALIARQKEDENVTVGESLMVDGLKFILSNEKLDGEGEPAVFRMATAILGQDQLTFLFIDQTGEYEDIPQAVVKSITFE